MRAKRVFLRVETILKKKLIRDSTKEGKHSIEENQIHHRSPEKKSTIPLTFFFLFLWVCSGWQLARALTLDRRVPYSHAFCDNHI
jgi:hypothetical protein